MARIQILELPSQVVGELVSTPFAVVIDQIGEASLELVASARADAQKLGAGGTIFAAGTLDVA